MKKIIEKIISKLIFVFKLYVLRDKQLIAYKKWVAENPNEEARYNYDLNKSSLVFDVGGYHGEFSDVIYKKFNCRIHIFEPYPKFFDMISKKFKEQNKIKCNAIGLSNKDSIMSIKFNGLGTYLDDNETANTIRVKTESIANYIFNNKVKKIDLLKLNVEGSEYEILTELINTGLVKNVKNIQVQFHKKNSNSENEYYALRNRLEKTHHLTYDYFMIWENWAINNK